MRPLILVFCVWSSLSPVFLGATPAEDFTAHKTGQLKIRQLRTEGEKEFGPNFDLRSFHDEVLKNGALPMSVLETHIRGWVAKRKGA